MKQIISEQLIENKKNDSVVKVTTFQEKYNTGDKPCYIYDYSLEEYFKRKQT